VKRDKEKAAEMIRCFFIFRAKRFLSYSTMEHNYKESFRKLTDFDLLDLLNKPEDVSPLAIQTAEEELASRNIPSETLDYLSEKINGNKARKEKNQQLLNTIKEKINKEVSDLILPEENPSIGKIVKIFCVILGIQFIFQLAPFYYTLSNAFNRVPVDFFWWEILSIIAPPLQLLMTLDLLFKKKRGWALLIALTGFGITLLLFQIIFYTDSLPLTDPYFWIQHLPAIGILLIFLRKSFRDYYKVSMDFATITIILSTILAVIYYFLLQLT
jgi:hypothetical protein